MTRWIPLLTLLACSSGATWIDDYPCAADELSDSAYLGDDEWGAYDCQPRPEGCDGTIGDCIVAYCGDDTNTAGESISEGDTVVAIIIDCDVDPFLLL
jgi:hypothetical protein